MRIEAVVDRAYRGIYWSQFTYVAEDHDVFIARRNKLAKSIHLKSWNGARLVDRIIFDIESYRLPYDHPEYYKGVINCEARYIFMFHDYNVNKEIEKLYTGSGFQKLPPLYCEGAESFQANARTIKELAMIVGAPFVERFSKNISFDEVIP